MSTPPPRHDLSSLRIDDGSRRTSKTGKRLGLFAAALGVVLLLGSLLLAFQVRHPSSRLPQHGPQAAQKQKPFSMPAVM